MIHSYIENWGNYKIASALKETQRSNSSYLAYAIFELGVELAATNACPIEYAAKAFTHIVLSPFKEDFNILTGLNYLVMGVWKMGVAILFDHFFLVVAIARLFTLNGIATRPLFDGASQAYHSYSTRSFRSA